MAEIKVEKKKPVWPWILAALIILAIILYFVLNDNEGQDDMDMEDDHMEEVETTYMNNEINVEHTVAWETLSPALSDASVYKV